jgi:hypothetical protein
MAGTKDTAEIETKRAHFMLIENVRRFMPEVCRIIHRSYLEKQCKSVKTLAEAQSILVEAKIGCEDQNLMGQHDLCSFMLDGIDIVRMRPDANPSYLAGLAVRAVIEVGHHRRKSITYGTACLILRDAILLGRHQELDVKVALARLEKTMEGAAMVEEIIADGARGVEPFPIHEAARVLEPA